MNNSLLDALIYTMGVVVIVLTGLGFVFGVAGTIDYFAGGYVEVCELGTEEERFALTKECVVAGHGYKFCRNNVNKLYCEQVRVKDDE